MRSEKRIINVKGMIVACDLRKLCAVKSQGFKADRGTYAANGKGSSTVVSEVAGAADGGRSKKPNEEK